MSLKSVLRNVKKALPLIIANAPVVISAVRSVKRAVKKSGRKTSAAE